MAYRIIHADVLDGLAQIEDGTVHTCVTSPPYWGLRDYGTDGQIGLERTPEEYVARIVQVFREVRRVLRDDGTLWLNLGDSYASFRDSKATPDTLRGGSTGTLVDKGKAANRSSMNFRETAIKHKDLVGIPWRTAFALQSDGWYLRQDIIWAKPNPMPESVRDRCTKSHEYIFLLSKQARYYYDADGIAEPLLRPEKANRATPAVFGGANKWPEAKKQSRLHSGNEYTGTPNSTRNRRSVWSVATQPFPGAHFAVFPPRLIEPCILAGAPVGGLVLDPFCGTGTTGMVALRHGRRFIGIELNGEYVEMAHRRIQGDAPLFNMQNQEVSNVDNEHSST